MNSIPNQCRVVCPRCGEEESSGQICIACKEQIKKFESIVSNGGIYFKCKGCTNSGVFPGTTSLAKSIRETMEIKAPDPCGIRFTNCGQHAGEYGMELNKNEH